MNGQATQSNRPSYRFVLFLFLVFCIPLLTSCESRKIIVNGLDEREANEIIVYLSTKSITAAKSQSTTSGGTGAGAKIVLWDISVPTDQALEAMSFLNQAGLPRRSSLNLLNIFTGTGLVPSEMEQKIRYQAGLAEQIASTIRKMDGILDAEVQISFPEEDPLNPNQKKQPITASVFVKHNGIMDDPNAHMVSKMKNLVAAGVPGLIYDNVTVISQLARYNEIHSELALAANEENKQYVSVWNLIIAKDSLTRFRVIFFSFTIVVLLLALLLVWILWKFYPTLKKEGGFKALLHLKPIVEEKKAESEKAASEKKEESNKEAAEQAKSIADKDIDQT